MLLSFNLPGVELLAAGQQDFQNPFLTVFSDPGNQKAVLEFVKLPLAAVDVLFVLFLRVPKPVLQFRTMYWNVSVPAAFPPSAVVTVNDV